MPRVKHHNGLDCQTSPKTPFDPQIVFPALSNPTGPPESTTAAPRQIGDGGKSKDDQLCSTVTGPLAPDELQSKQIFRRDTPVACASCGRIIPRMARQQKFCSSACRKRAARYLGSKSKNKSRREPPLQKCGTNPQKTINGIKAAPTPIFGPRSVIEVEIIEARDWQEVISHDGVSLFRFDAETACAP